MVYESRNNYTIFPHANIENKNINKELIKAIDNTQIQKYEKEILEIYETEKKSLFGKNNSLFMEYYSDKNLNISNRNKSEIYHKIKNADLIEKAIDKAYLNELSKKIYLI